MAAVESLWRYPITGGPGISVEEIDVIAGGFVDDRTLILAEETDEGLRRIGTKQAPQLLQMRYNNYGSAVQLGAHEIELPAWQLDAEETPDTTCYEFGDYTPVLFVVQEYDDAFSTFLDREVRLVRKSSRWQLGDHIAPRDRANASLHVIGAESVEAIAEASGSTLGPDPRRAKANIVTRGLEAHAELGMIGESLWIGSVVTSCWIQIVRGTARCPVPSLDPETGENLGDMSLRVMPKSPNREGKEAPSAGVYAHMINAHGHITVGDSISIKDL